MTLWASVFLIACGTLYAGVSLYCLWRIALEPALEWALMKYADHRVRADHPRWFL